MKTFDLNCKEEDVGGFGYAEKECVPTQEAWLFLMMDILLKKCYTILVCCQKQIDFLKKDDSKGRQKQFFYLNV